VQEFEAINGEYSIKVPDLDLITNLKKGPSSRPGSAAGSPMPSKPQSVIDSAAASPMPPSGSASPTPGSAAVHDGEKPAEKPADSATELQKENG